MIITFFRSSSYTSWDFCPTKYFFDYTLGFHSPANKKAEKGSIVHKALELLARRKLAEQEEKQSFSDELGDFLVSDITPDKAIELAFKNADKAYDFYDYDFHDCHKWMTDALQWKGGMFSPLKRKIISPEQYFEFTIDESWASYDYTLADGNRLAGQLGLKGTLDLIVEQEGGHGLELIDWKTGRRVDWATGQEKTFEKLMDDPQLRIYHYATCRLFPAEKNIFITIFYIQDGGPQSLCFQRDEMVVTEQMLRKRFNEIRNTVKPKAIYPDWKCSKLCYFGKNDLQGNPVVTYEDSACKQLRSEIVQLGIDKVTEKHGKDVQHNTYGVGGGRKNDINGSHQKTNAGR